MAPRARTQFAASIRVVYQVFLISETCYRYEAKLSDENELNCILKGVNIEADIT